MWQTVGQYQFEVGENSTYTGWCRCVGGRLASGEWPAWNIYTGEQR